MGGDTCEVCGGLLVKVGPARKCSKCGRVIRPGKV